MSPRSTGEPDTGRIGLLLKEHRVEERGAFTAGREISVRADHVLLAESEACLALLTLQGAGVEHVATEMALCVAGRGGIPLDVERSERLRWLAHACARLGLHYLRPGAGLAHQVHLARLAAPTKLLVASGAAAAACGALGMCGFEITEAEAAAVLSGAPLRLVVPECACVSLVGSLPYWAGVSDVGVALEPLLRTAPAHGRAIEFEGPGVATLSVADRALLAVECAARGARTVLFPSDDRSRAFLRAQGREPDWKPPVLRSAEDEPGEPQWPLDLGTLEPRATDARGVARPVRDLAAEVSLACVGPEAGLVHIERLVRMLAGRALAPGLELRVIPGSRQILAGAAERGWWRELERSGVRIDEVAGDGARLESSWPAGTGVVFGLGRDTVGAARHPHLYRADLATVVASALTGRLVDPRDLEMERPVDAEPEAYPIRDERWQRPGAQESLEPGSVVAVRPPGPPRPLERPIRGVVLARLGDRSGPAGILSESPRDRARETDLPSLADRACAVAEPRFAFEARRRGGGVLVAGAEFGAAQGTTGGARAAMVLAELGVRALLARSWVAEWRRDVIHYGGLPLTFADDVAFAAVHAGDELEVPTLPEGLEPHRPLVVRNLTHGTQVALRHDLNAREIAVVLSGGLMGGVRATVAERRARSKEAV